MFGRRRDIQIPKVPVSGDKATQSWMTAVGSMLSKYIGGGSNDRLVSAGELIDAGLAGTGTGGFLTLPPRNLTKPPKVTGLTANGALASIFVQWSNPSFSNYGYTELWRADIDDIGQAFLIASTAVESYTDNVGSAATKYYWARAVSDQGVKGDFNAASGTKGTTSLDPDYVMQVLTSSTWKPNTTYYPFQYVRPTVENGFQYAAVDGGKSGSVEPTWPTTINATVGDGTIQWTAVPVDERIPFVLGTLEDGTPAVFMDTAYIKNASITSAKIGSLVADKIETGNLIADLQVKNKLWYGFNFPNGVFVDLDTLQATVGKSGFYLGVDSVSSLPVLHLNTGIANGSRRLYFDGVQLKIENVDLVSSSDGYFDDLKGDSVEFNRALFRFLACDEPVVPSDHIYDAHINVSDPTFENYLCYENGCVKKESNTSGTLIVGTGYSRPFAFYQSPQFTSIKPYDYSSNTTRYRCKTENVKLAFGITVSGAASVGTFYGGSYMDFYIFNESQSLPSNEYNYSTATTGVPSAYLLKAAIHNQSGGTVAAYKNTGSGDVYLFNIEIEKNSTTNANKLIIRIDDDNKQFAYKSGRTLKAAVVYKQFYQAGGSEDDTIYGQITIEIEMDARITKQTPINDAQITL